MPLRPTGFTPGAGGPCTDLDYNWNILNDAVLDVTVPSQGVLRLTQVDGGIVNNSIPHFPNQVNSGLPMAFQSTPTASTLDYAAGTYQIAAVVYSVAAPGSLVANAGDPVNPRVDIVSLTTLGTVVYTPGVAAPSPVKPAIPAGNLLVGVIGVSALASAATGGYTLESVNYAEGSSSGLPVGTADSQTLRWDAAGSSWATNSTLKGDGTRTRVGAGSVTTGANAEVLQVNGRIEILDQAAPAVTANKLYSVAGDLWYDTFQLTPPAGGLSAGTVVNSTVRWDGATWQENTRFLAYENATNFGAGTTTSFGAGNNNVAFGPDTLKSNTNGDQNSAFGDGALENNTTGDNCVAVGYNAANGNNSGTDNTVVGSQAFSGNGSGSFNTVVGSLAAPITTGQRNTVLGYTAGTSLTSGADNVIIGSNSATGLVNGSRNIAIGSNVSVAPSLVNTLAIGSGATVTASNWVVMGSDTTNYAVLWFGRGRESSTVEDVSIVSTERFGVADTVGNNLNVIAGTSTGSAKGGSIRMRTSSGGAAGVTKNASSTVAEFTPDSFVNYRGLAQTAATIAAPTTASPTVGVYLVTTSGGALTITLPTTGIADGQTWTFKDRTGNAGANNVTLDPSGATLIDNAATFKLQSPWASATVMWNAAASRYYVIA